MRVQKREQASLKKWKRKWSLQATIILKYFMNSTERNFSRYIKFYWGDSFFKVESNIAEKSEGI